MDNQIGKLLILIGAGILILGVVLYFFGGNLKWLGHLPGDIRIERKNFSFYFPLGTLILLNLIIFLIFRIWRWIN
ncbi:MAG TPA: DUF2905 domain-containing protein [Mucilaginibacter sp.]|jgi:Mg2+ and Co2+ transporter CorA